MCDVEIPLSFLAVRQGGQPAVLTLGVHIFPACLAFECPEMAFRCPGTEQKAPSCDGFGTGTLLEIWPTLTSPSSSFLLLFASMEGMTSGRNKTTKRTC